SSCAIRRSRICVACRHQASNCRRAGFRPRGPPSRRARTVRDMTFCVDELEDGASAAARLGALRPSYFREAAVRTREASHAVTRLVMLTEMFPLMKTLYNSEATAATECQDLMRMSFRTFHFDGAVRVPSYLAWLMDCDMRETYTFHHRVLKLLQCHCPPDLWH